MPVDPTQPRIRRLTSSTADCELGRTLVREYMVFTHEEALGHQLEGMPATLENFEPVMPDSVHFADCYMAADAAYFVAERSGDVLGGVGISRHDSERAVMRRLWVRPAGRGTGWGRRLAEAAVEEARRLGYAAMVLDVAPYRLKALELYRDLGFVERDPIADYPFEMIALERAFEAP